MNKKLVNQDPFSNGSEAMYFECQCCGGCVKYSCSDGKPRRLQGRCYEVQDWGGDTLFYERSQMEVAYRTGIGQKKLQEALKNTDKAIIDHYIIIKHNEREKPHTDDPTN